MHWRRSLNFDPAHGAYTVNDIFEDATIPAVRSVISKVLLDIPFYFSPHHGSIVSILTTELNRLYRLYIQRNPDFEQRGGTVSIMGHSLGSVLTADILTQQPTIVPPLSQVEAPQIHSSSKHLLFNVRNFFCVGSPLALMLYLTGSQIRARRRSGDGPASNPSDEITCDEVGRDGCFAAENIYNVRLSAVRS